MEYFNQNPEGCEGRRDRIRSRLAEKGLEALKEHEIVEFLLYYAIPRQDVNGLAREVLNHFGTLEGVLNGVYADFVQVKGLGRTGAKWMAQLGEMISTLELPIDPDDDIRLRCFRDLYRYALRCSEEMPPPASLMLFISREDQLLFRLWFPSRAWGEAECLRQVVVHSFQVHASGVFVVQYIGKYNLEPDAYDIRKAKACSDTLHAAGCALLDVALVGWQDAISMRRQGLVPEPPLKGDMLEMRERYLRGFDF